MSKKLSKISQSKNFLESFRSTYTRGIFEKGKTGKLVFLGVFIGNKKILFTDKHNDETISLLLHTMHEIGGNTEINETVDLLLGMAQDINGNVSEERFNKAIVFMKTLKPKDPIEARLLAQHFILNEKGLRFLGSCNTTEMLKQAQFHGNIGIKMLRLSQESIHTLTRYRAGGVQQINVVHMHDNAKAIIAHDMGGGNAKLSDRPLENNETM